MLIWKWLHCLPFACCRSLSNLHSQKTRSMRSVHTPWYQKPLLQNNKYVNVQKGAMFASLFSLVSKSLCAEMAQNVSLMSQFTSKLTNVRMIANWYCRIKDVRANSMEMKLEKIFSVFPVPVPFHNRYWRFWHLLLIDGRTRLRPLWLLLHFIRIRLRRKSQW